MDSPALDSAGTPMASGSMGVTPLGSIGVTPLGSETSSPYSKGKIIQFKLRNVIIIVYFKNIIL